jgi:hypothetical protein
MWITARMLVDNSCFWQKFRDKGKNLFAELDIFQGFFPVQYARKMIIVT